MQNEHNYLATITTNPEFYGETTPEQAADIADRIAGRVREQYPNATVRTVASVNCPGIGETSFSVCIEGQRYDDIPDISDEIGCFIDTIWNTEPSKA